MLLPVKAVSSTLSWLGVSAADLTGLSARVAAGADLSGVTRALRETLHDPTLEVLPGTALPGTALLGSGGFDALLVDIDHSPRHVLHPSHADFYSPAGLRRMARHLLPGGVFALWSDDPPDQDFLAALQYVFTVAFAHVIEFPNPITGGASANTVYTAK